MPDWANDLAPATFWVYDTTAMRTGFSVVVGLAFTVAFVTFFIVHSVLGYLTSPTAIVDAAKANETRELALDAVQRLVGEQLAHDHAEIESAVMSRAREVIDDAVSSRWFYDTLADTYPGLVTFVETGDDTEVIDLRETRHRLHRELTELGDQVESECAQVIGAAACQRSSELAQFMGKFRRAVDRAIEQIPEETTLRTLLQDAGARSLVADSPELKRARRAIAAARTARWVSALVMIALLGLLVMLNSGKLQRALLAVGLALVFASIAHFITVAAADGPVRDAVSERIDAERERAGHNADVVAAGQKLVLSMAERSVADQNGTVALILVAGVACVGGAFVVGWRRSRD